MRIPPSSNKAFWSDIAEFVFLAPYKIVRHFNHLD